MRFGEGYGEACRFCGSTEIIVSPPSSAGNCAHCSDEAKAWTARQERLADHQAAMARVLIADADEKRRVAETARRWANRRATVVESFNGILIGTVSALAGLRPARARHGRGAARH